jgi:MFS family permease
MYHQSNDYLDLDRRVFGIYDRNTHDSVLEITQKMINAILKHFLCSTKVVGYHLLQLNRPVPLLSEKEAAAEVERNYRWNFTVNLLDGVTFWFGLNFASSSTIIPLFISKLTMNPIIIGLIPVFAYAGWQLPQLLTASPTERLARKKPIAVNVGFFTERLPVWLWPLAALLASQFPVLALFVFFGAYAWHALGAGLIAPAWQDLIARCFPVNRRGRFFGVTTFIGTGVGAIGAIFSSWLLKTYSFPLNFIYTFLIAAVFINVSWVFLALTREPVQLVPPRQPGTDHFWQKLVRIIREDHNFRRFLQARVLMGLGMMGLGFVTVAAVQQWHVADSTVALYTMALLMGQASGNLLAGLLADRFGHKLSLEIGITSAVIGFTLAWLASSPFWYYSVFILLGIVLGARIVSGIMITMEFSPPAQRPTYIGISNTIAGLSDALAPLLGGWLAGFSYKWLFALSASISLLSVFFFRQYVKEPRHEPTDTVLSSIQGGLT